MTLKDLNQEKDEEIVQDSEEKFKALYDNAPLPYQSLNEDGNFNDVNPSWLRTLGYDRKEVIGKWFGGFLHPDWKPHFERNFPEFKRRGHVHDVQFKIRHKDGHYLDISFEGYIGHNPDGSFKQTYCVFQDITERKKAEEALRDSRYMLQTVLDSIPAAVFWKDRDSIYLGGNRTWLEAAGLKSSEEVVGKSDYDLPWDQKQADSFQEDDRTVIESGIPKYDIIEPYLQADGTHAWAKTNKVPLRDTEGNVVGVLGTYEDITEHKQVEDALRESEENLRAILDASPDVIHLLDINGIILSTNDGFAKRMGLEVEDVVGTCVFDYVPTESLHNRKAAVEKVFRTGEPLQLEDRGLTGIFESHIHPVFNPAGEVTAVAVYARDITERKQAEKALWERIKELKCLYNIAEISNRPEIALDELFQESVSLLPLGWQYPEITGCRITVDGKVYSTKNFKETKWMQREDIHTTNKIFGTVEVCYLKEKPDENEGPFFEEERKLIKNIAGQLGEHITRKQAEEELREKAYIIQSSSSVIATADLDGKMTYVNPSFLRAWGFEDDGDVLGRPFREFWVVEERLGEIMDALHRKRQWSDEIQARRKDGSLFDVQVSAAMVFDSQNKPIAFMSTSIDITERKQAEKELQERMNELETFYRTTLGREERVIEMKQEVNELLEQLGKNKKYRDYSKE